MRQIYFKTGLHGASSLLASLLLITAVQAQTITPQQLPGAADAGRVEPQPNAFAPRPVQGELVLPSLDPHMVMPEGASSTPFTLKSVTIKGATAFSKAELADLYQAALNKPGTLDVIWRITHAITNRYREAGYFLSRAYVPEQEITNGQVVIHVLEGYVTGVQLNHSLNDHYLLQQYTRPITQQKPVTNDAIESLLLRLDDLAGVTFRGVLKPVDTKLSGTEGAVELVLDVEPEAGRGLLSMDNFGSRYLGPFSVTGSYQTSFIPLQQTTLSLSSTLPVDELRYLALDHQIPLAPNWSLGLSGNTVKAQPGYLLEDSNIKSNATELAVNLQYQWLRQRQQNLALGLTLDGQNSNGDVLGDTPLTRDRIRALRFSATYDNTDNWQGLNTIRTVISQGLKWLGASDKGDTNLSRSEATPSFTKAELSYQRQQYLTADFLLSAQLAGQYSNDALFSSEETSIGGQQFGRAYDPSEITGDKGLAAALELRYISWQPFTQISLQPYVFYDIGKAWNNDTDGNNISAASTGAGMRFGLPYGINGNLGMALPLTKPTSAPQYGNGKNPRLLFQLSTQF